MPQPPGGPAPAQQGVGACWQHNNRTEARTGLLRCGRQGGKSAGQHWLLVLALPTRKLPLGEIVPHGSLHLASCIFKKIDFCDFPELIAANARCVE